MGSDEIRPGDTIAGKYRVVRLLGRSRGLLVEAVHEEADQRVALQLLGRAQGDTAAVERFRQEARALGKLTSEYVARVLDVGTQGDGSFYLVRQWLEGEDLGSWIKNQEKVPVEQAVLLVLQACEAVAEAHAHGIVLRELTPSHLFVTQRLGGAPLLKLVDFGTAKLLSGGTARGGPEVTSAAVFGLSPYSSPELVRKSSIIDLRSDIWSLGTILYELLCGRAPFAGSPADLMLKIIKEAPQPMAAQRGDVPSELDGVLNWALAKDYDERFRTVHAFAHALGPYAPPEGKVLIDRIAEIAKVAKQRRQAERSARQKQEEPAPPTVSPRSAEPKPASGEDEMSITDTEVRDPPFEECRSDRPPAVQAGERTRSSSHAAVGTRTAPQRTSSRPGPVFAGAAADIELLLGTTRASDPPAEGGAVVIPPAPALPTFDAPKAQLAPWTQVSVGTPHTPGAVGAPPRPISNRPPPPAHPSVPPVAPHPSVPPTAAAQLEPEPFVDQLTTARKIGIVAVAAACVALPTLFAIFLLRRPNTTTGAVAAAPASAQVAVSAAPPMSPPEAQPGEPVPSGATAPSPRTATGPGPHPAGSAATGTLIAVAVGGTCTFAVNGSSRGSGSTLKVALKAGPYTVTCTPQGGAPKSRSVTVKPGDTAMATFKLP